MKFSILTPALFAALAASANAATFVQTDASSCELASNLYYCGAHTAEADCTADEAHFCAWSAEDEECNFNEASEQALIVDAFAAFVDSSGQPPDAFSTAAKDCLGETDEDDCNAVDGCAWQELGEQDGCALDAAGWKTYMTEQEAPKGVIGMWYTMQYEATVCGAAATEDKCVADGCEWAEEDDEEICRATDKWLFDTRSEICGSNGDFAGAGAAAGLSSGAADSASRFAVLAASAVAAASLLA